MAGEHFQIGAANLAQSSGRNGDLDAIQLRQRSAFALRRVQAHQEWGVEWNLDIGEVREAIELVLRHGSHRAVRQASGGARTGIMRAQREFPERRLDVGLRMDAANKAEIEMVGLCHMLAMN